MNWRVLGVVVLSAGLSHAGSDADVRQVLEKFAPSIVTVKVVVERELSMGGQSQTKESREELQGVVVDPSGLIMMSSAAFDSDETKELLKGMGKGDVDVKTTPTDFKVVIGQEEKEYEAFLAATDTKLNLAFLQISDLGERKLDAVGFDVQTELSVGQEVIAVGRLKKGYDYAPYVATTRVGGRIAKPRAACIVFEDLAGVGLPVFTMSGEVAGVLGEIPSGLTEDSDKGMALLSRLLGGSSSGAAGPSFVFPPAVINGVVEQALKQAADVAAERAKKQEEEKDAPKPGEGKEEK